MPDVFLLISRRWNLIVLLTIAATAAAFLASLLSPKLYLGSTTALPVNTLVNDKARIFNQNIEALYSEIGTADELDKIEGTARLDTVFLAAANTYHLAAHYGLDTTAGDALEKAAVWLRKNSDIVKTGYGELNIKVWDKEAATAATLANGLMQTLNGIYERLQTENNQNVLHKLKETFAAQSDSMQSLTDRVLAFESGPRIIEGGKNKFFTDSLVKPHRRFADEAMRQAAWQKSLQQYTDLINEYELAVTTAPKALLVVEQARPSPWYDRPKTLRNVLIAFAASLLFSFLLAVFIESRNQSA